MQWVWGEIPVQEIPDVMPIRECPFDYGNRVYLIVSTITLFALGETGDTLWDSKELNKAYDGVYPGRSNVVLFMIPYFLVF